MLPPLTLNPASILAFIRHVTCSFCTFIQLINKVVGDMLEFCSINHKVAFKLSKIGFEVRHYYVTQILDRDTIKKTKQQHKVSHKLIYNYLRPLIHQSIETPLSGRSNYNCRFTPRE